jgi:cell division GTPase FtsZ
MIIEIDKMGVHGYYISVGCNGDWLHNSDIDKVLQHFSDFSYEELAIKFGAYIDDSDHYDEVYFENLNDAKRMRDFLIEIMG